MGSQSVQPRVGVPLPPEPPAAQAATQGQSGTTPQAAATSAGMTRQDPPLVQVGQPQPVPGNRENGQPGGVAPAVVTPLVPAGDDAPDPRVTLAAGPAPGADALQPPGSAAPPVRPLPPVGATPMASTPPISVPGPGGAARPPVSREPQVESFDEEVYRWKPGDTFERISEQFYHTNKYAQALMLFNRTHPLAAQGVLHNPPALQVGQSVFIPPLSILEKRHSAAIPELTPVQVPPLPATERRVNSSPATTTSTPKPAAPLTPGQKYRVRGVAERMWDIAQRTLGNGERWREIYERNRGFRPEMPLPPDTVLDLPPDAKVDPGNGP
jgi:nucleoid-associated protein YgaU